MGNCCIAALDSGPLSFNVSCLDYVNSEFLTYMTLKISVKSWVWKILLLVSGANSEIWLLSLMFESVAFLLEFSAIVEVLQQTPVTLGIRGCRQWMNECRGAISVLNRHSVNVSTSVLVSRWSSPLQARRHRFVFLNAGTWAELHYRRLKTCIVASQ